MLNPLFYELFWNFARKQQVSSVPAKYYSMTGALWLRRRLNLVLSDFMRRCVSHRSTSVPWNGIIFSWTRKPCVRHKHRITANYPVYIVLYGNL